MRFLLLFLFITLYSVAMTSQSLMEVGSSMNFKYIHWLDGENNVKFESLNIVKDTAFNSKNYKVIQFTEDSQCDRYDLKEFFRMEDSIVYRYDHTSETDFPIMNFNDVDTFEMKYRGGFDNPNEVFTATAIVDSTAEIIVYDGTKINVKYLRILNNRNKGDRTTYRMTKEIGFLDFGPFFPSLGGGLCDPIFLYGGIRCVWSDQDTIHFTDKDCYETSVSTQQIITNKFQVSPNPFSHSFTIPEKIHPLKIYNISGKSIDFQKNQTTISLPQTSAGIYFMKFRTNTGKIKTVKLIKN